MLSLAACSGDAPDETAEDDTAAVIEDTSPSPDNSPTVREPAGDMEGEPDADGNRWFYKADSRTALFGPPQSEGVLSIGCGPSTGPSSAITVIHYSAAQEGEEEELVFAGENGSASLRVAAEATQLGPDYIWQGDISPPARDLRRVFAESDSPVTVRLESGDTMDVPASEAVVRAIDACS